MIDAQVTGHLGVITLNRPEAHNALDQAAMTEMTALLNDWAENQSLRALIVTGTGRSFCSGASLADVAGSDWNENPLTTLCNTLEAFPAPSIARLNGGAYGGGVELALACDFRVGVAGMKAFVPPARLGIHYEPDGIKRALDRLGTQTTKRMFLLAERFDDEALLRAGFLDFLVQPEELDGKVDALTQTLTGLAPLAVQGMKRAIFELLDGNLDRDAARERIKTCFASQDHAEGLAAQSEKRTPEFAGK